jgi:hypothetical protein
MGKPVNSSMLTNDPGRIVRLHHLNSLGLVRSQSLYRELNEAR